MRAPEALTAFVREALAAGRARDEIAAALAAAGWSGSEIRAALAAWIDAPGLPPVPRPRGTVSPRDALVHATLFLALGTLALNLGALIFALIDIAVADPLAAPSAWLSGRIRWSVAALVIAWLLWAWLSLRIAREGARDPGARRSGVARWLTAIALFLAAATLLGDLITLVAWLLRGEVTLRFLLKVLTVGAIAGAVIFAYLPDAGFGEPARRARALPLVAGFGIAGAVAVALGLSHVGGPGAGRLEQRDAARLDHIREIARAVVCHAGARAAPLAPTELAEITPACLSAARAGVLRDPAGGAAYRVAWPEAGLVQVCADFESAGRAIEGAQGWPPFDPATGCVSASMHDGS
jgi:hypothetical protein